MHLKVQAVGMRVIAADVVQARAQLERPFQRGLQSGKLSARHKRAEVVDAALDLL